LENSCRIAVLVSGRGSNLMAIIDAAERGEIRSKIELVISDNKEAYALTRAKEHGIRTLFIDPKEFKTREDYDRQIVKHLKEHQIELVCLAGYMLLVTPYFVQEYKNRIMNIHPALLPAFPGLDVQRKAIEYGVKVTGCTVHFVDEGCDTGPIIIQRAVPVLEDDTPETLSARILKEEHNIYKEAIRLFEEGRLVVEGRRVRIKSGRNEDLSLKID